MGTSVPLRGRGTGNPGRPVALTDKPLPFYYAEIFHTLKEAQVLIERWRLEYNTFRPHSSLNNRPPAPEAWLH